MATALTVAALLVLITVVAYLIGLRNAQHAERAAGPRREGAGPGEERRSDAGPPPPTGRAHAGPTASPPESPR
ncbi:hypothetical protein [Streptomyces sp. NPDC048650]|uniref:hypothetical protein n=1 Tax=unclassified Streptomyces TaxID=2593676 RepID=UPI003721E889